MAGKGRRFVAQQQDSRDLHFEHQPPFEKEGEAQAIGTPESEGERREDAQDHQGGGPSCFQAEGTTNAIVLAAICSHPHVAEGQVFRSMIGAACLWASKPIIKFIIEATNCCFQVFYFIR